MEESQPITHPDPAVSATLHEMARLLRGTDHLGPQTQQALAELADQLGKAFEQTQPPVKTPANFIESIAKVVETLHHSEGSRPLTAAMQRLQELAVSAETQAPAAANFARRLAAALADVGI